MLYLIHQEGELIMSDGWYATTNCCRDRYYYNWSRKRRQYSHTNETLFVCLCRTRANEDALALVVIQQGLDAYYHEQAKEAVAGGERVLN